MNKSNLVKIISTFSPREIKELGDFVQSPFFNKNESTIKLYKYIRKRYPEFNAEKMKKEMIYKNLFPGKKYNDGLMRTVIFNLNSLAEEYLTQLNFKKNKARYSIMLLDELNNRKLDKLLLKHIPEVNAEVANIEDKNRDYFYYKYLVESIIFSYRNWSRYKKKNLKDYDDEGIKNEIHYLLCFTLSKTLANYRFLISKSETVQVDIHLDILDEIIQHLLGKKNEYIYETSVRLHLYEIMLIRDKSEKYFNLLKDMLVDPDFKITKDEKFSLHNILQIYCTHKIFSGNTKYKKDRFELYKASLKYNFYSGSEDIYFDDLLFANIVLVGLQEKEIHWTKKFIDNYKDLLSPVNKEITVNYCRARLYHTKGEHEKGLELLNSIKSIKHVQFKLVIRNLTLMLYYELSMFDSAYSYYDSYRHFLKDNASTLAKARYERQNNFLKLYYRLAKLKEKPCMRLIEELAYDIENNPNVLEKEWLVEKIKQALAK